PLATSGHHAVARFIASPAMNLREVSIPDGAADVGGHRLPLLPRLGRNIDRVVIGCRPEVVDVDVDDDLAHVVVTTEVVEDLAADAYLFGSIDADGRPRRGGPRRRSDDRR